MLTPQEGICVPENAKWYELFLSKARKEAWVSAGIP
jgi:hypothetical protein